MTFYFKFSEDDKTFNLSMEHEGLNQINVILKTRHRSRISPHGVRSKYVCIPNKVIQSGNHIINEVGQGEEGWFRWRMRIEIRQNCYREFRFRFYFKAPLAGRGGVWGF